MKNSEMEMEMEIESESESEKTYASFFIFSFVKCIIASIEKMMRLNTKMVYCKLQRRNEIILKIKEIKWTSQLCNDEMQKLTHLKQWLAFYQQLKKKEEKKNISFCLLHCMQNILYTYATSQYFITMCIVWVGRYN